jgi:hypothetical protein
MKTVTELPNPIHCIETAWIPMPDGCKLAARIWLPDDAEQNPVPAVLEYIPYRRRDHTRARDALMMPYTAGHGYACLRVDLRGSGDSDGVLLDEYLEQEQDDALEVLRWIAAQPWCDGSVGIIGISWGGFNGLQIAARRPPELKAVISACFTDDRYADDVHYMGGCLLGDNLSWASVMFAFNSCPPDPLVVGERWRTMWFERLEKSGLWLEKWMRHPHRDAYWKHGSVCEDYSSIETPVLAISGWADGYSNAVFRLLANLGGSHRGLIGPWSHAYPHLGKPGPAIGFLQEAVRWWDHWLKGIDRAVDKEPRLRVWMQDSVPPHPSYKERPGRWVAEDSWPSPRIGPKTYAFGKNRLVPLGERVSKAPLTFQSPLSVGLFAGKWCSYAAPPDLPHDQREEDGGALVFDTDPLDEPLEILGAPVVDLELSSAGPVAMVAVRLSDIAPNGDATRVTYGLLNLTHRDSHEQPSSLVPGERYRVRVQLNDVAQRFPAGHRIRVAISTSYFPLAWPPPSPTPLTLYPADCSLVLPTRKPRDADQRLRPFDDAEATAPIAKEVVEPEDHRWTVTRDLANDVSTLEVVKDDGVVRLEEIDLEIGESTVERYSYRRGDYSSVRGEVVSFRSFRRDGWDVHTETRTVLTSNETHFHIHASLDAYEDERRVFSRNYNCSIPRDEA